MPSHAPALFLGVIQAALSSHPQPAGGIAGKWTIPIPGSGRRDRSSFAIRCNPASARGPIRADPAKLSLRGPAPRRKCRWWSAHAPRPSISQPSGRFARLSPDWSGPANAPADQAPALDKYSSMGALPREARKRCVAAERTANWCSLRTQILPCRSSKMASQGPIGKPSPMVSSRRLSPPPVHPRVCKVASRPQPVPDDPAGIDVGAGHGFFRLDVPRAGESAGRTSRIRLGCPRQSAFRGEVQESAAV